MCCESRADPPFTPPLLFNAIHVFLFCLGDLFGRHLCAFPCFHIWSPLRLLSLSLAHTLFIPFFIVCNIQLPASSPIRPSLLRPISSGSRSPLINSDLLFFLVLFAFGTSNGLKNQEDVDTAVTIGLFCMVGGKTVGSFMSFAITMVVCRCNPFKSE